MRIKHKAIDSDIKRNIEISAADLIRVGVRVYEGEKLKEDPLIEKAIELYCKAQADFEGKGTQYEASYEKLRDAMSLCGDYTEK